jgi:hypothetical protein
MFDGFYTFENIVMSLKKHPKNDINGKRGLYFVLALLLILLLIYLALEWKTAHDNNGYDIGAVHGIKKSLLYE